MISHKQSFVVDDATGATFWPTNAGACFNATNARFRVAGVDLAALYASADNRYKLVAKDTALKKVEGFIDVADSAEALGSDEVTNGDVEAAVPDINGTAIFNSRSTSAQDAGQKHGGANSVKVTSDGTLTDNFYTRYGSACGLTDGILYYMEVWVYLPSAQANFTNLYLREQQQGSERILATTTVTDTWTRLSGYFIQQHKANDFHAAVQSNVIADPTGYFFYWDDLVIEPVTNVGADGVLIMSTKGGSTQSWALQESGIDLNDIATFEVQRATRHHSL